jgi:hypothetical protein
MNTTTVTRRAVTYAVSASLLALALTACGSTSSASPASSAASSGNAPASTTSAPSAPAAPAPTASPATTAAPASTPRKSATGTLAVYKPSSVISNTGSGKNQQALILSSPSPVTKVGAFYVSALKHGGWRTVSAAKSAYSVNLTARRGKVGVTIAVSKKGHGSTIAVTTHPV